MTSSRTTTSIYIAARIRVKTITLPTVSRKRNTPLPSLILLLKCRQEYSYRLRNRPKVICPANSKRGQYYAQIIRAGKLEGGGPPVFRFEF